MSCLWNPRRPDYWVWNTRSMPKATKDELNAARATVLKHFRWIDGDADVWSMLRDPEALAAIIRGLAAPYRSAGVTVVVAIESRGFLLGAAVAIELGVGFAAIRKDGALFPGDKQRIRTEPDYRGNTRELSALRSQFSAGDRALLIDDWIETGSQALAARAVVEACGAELSGLSVIIDETTAPTRKRLPPVMAIVSSLELP
jgi:adenine phosphoribosyltransferase